MSDTEDNDFAIECVNALADVMYIGRTKKRRTKMLDSTPVPRCVRTARLEKEPSERDPPCRFGMALPHQHKSFPTRLPASTVQIIRGDRSARFGRPELFQSTWTCP
ncbi:hypothetical protein [Stieleria maiorica]|uniref:hypothetical protein n=1 Tax=Stieleria maiorica TaxID=2795974 RepID=UPI00142F3956|nr:hypothetical protein [Stieleria maiorica]